MRKRFVHQAVLITFLLFQFSNCLAAESPDPNDPNRYLNAVRTFADNVLKYGRDNYGPKHTPLFVDGLNIHTHEPVKWIDPDGTKWILSNLSSQQDLFRTFDGLSTVTGDPGYKSAAKDAIRYAFINLRSPNGLLHWGGHQAYNATNDRPHGRHIHELKGFYPHYDLMWEVDPEATRQFIEAFWSGHIIHWATLEMNRHSNMNRPLEKPWDHDYKGGPVFLQSNGHSFFNTGSDLIYAGAILSHLSTEKEPLVWAKRLARRYVDTRHPETGISYWMYTKPPGNRSDFHDVVLQKLMPGTTPFLPSDFPWYVYTNPVQRKFYRSYCMPTPAIPVNTQIFHWQCLLLLGEVLGDKGDEFKQWALEELTAFGKASYRKRDNVYVPILTDGTNLEGYIVRESGPLGPNGVTLEPIPLEPSDLWAYAMAYRITGDHFMWEMARDIALGNDFGDIGVAPEDKPKLRVRPACSNPYALLAFLELHRGTGKDEYRKVARSIADNVLANRFHKGYFTASNKHIYTKFNAVDSLALLHLQAALSGRISEIPEVWPSTSFLDLPYRLKEAVSENRMIYTLTESTEPPKSLQEVAAEGDLQAVRSMIRHGTPADQMEDGFKKTALHHAAIKGHKDVVELLLNSGADVNTEDSFPGATPLHYAAENRHKEIAGLLIANGADLRARRGYPADDTPLHSAVRAGHKDIVELLITKGANVTAKNKAGQTPLDIAVRQKNKEIVELLRKHGAKE